MSPMKTGATGVTMGIVQIFGFCPGILDRSGVLVGALSALFFLAYSQVLMIVFLSPILSWIRGRKLKN